MKKVRKFIVLAQAFCEDCDFEDTYHVTAQKSGREHALKTGHIVTVETGYCQTYNEKEGE